MPVLLAPLLLIGVALLAYLWLLMYEQGVAIPLQGLANNVPVIGGYLKRGVAAAVDYGRALFAKYVLTYVDKLVDWLLGLAASVEHFVGSVNRYLVELPDQLDFLLHVSVHDVVKAFVNPIRNTANEALQDATAAALGVQALAGQIAARFKGIEGDVESSIDHAVDVIRNVDLPHLERVINQGVQHAVDGVAGDIAATQDWAAGWIDDLLNRVEQIPIEQLLAGAAAGTAAAALVQVIANEAGLGRAECRAKVKNICATDPRAWQHLLAIAVPLFAFPGLRELIDVASELVPQLAEAVVAIGEGL